MNKKSKWFGSPTRCLYQGLSSSDTEVIDYNDVMGDKNRDGGNFFPNMREALHHMKLSV